MPVRPRPPAVYPPPPPPRQVQTYAGKPPAPRVRRSGDDFAFFRHAAVISALLLACFLSYCNSFKCGWTLDNLYIIKLDPRTKAISWQDRQGDPAAPWGVSRIWSEDYWWPKGISGLYRPITSFTYWVNWTGYFDPQLASDNWFAQAGVKTFNALH